MTDTSARPGHADAGPVAPVAPVARDRLAVQPIPRSGVRLFRDSDVYKVLEAIAWARRDGADPEQDRFFADAVDLQGLQLHQFASGRVGADLAAAGRLDVELESGYPQAGTLRVRVLAVPGGTAELAIRVPSSVREITVTLNGRPADTEPGDDRYLRLRRTWSDGDELTLEFPLRPRTIQPDPRIDAVRSCVAFERGPLVTLVSAGPRCPPPINKVRRLRRRSRGSPPE